MRKEYGELLVSIVLIIISAFPLFDLLYNVTNINNISDFSLVVIIVMLIVILISSIIYFISYWMEKFQLHFKGAVYTVPEIYQVRGLHNSSSLYKITIAQRGISRFEDGCQNAEVGGWSRKNTWLTSYLRNPDLQLSRLEQQTHNLEVLGSNPSWSTRRKRKDGIPSKGRWLVGILNIELGVWCIPSFDTLAQLVEQQIFNLWVMGSSPICITIDDSVNL